jgi:hypothetical protein
MSSIKNKSLFLQNLFFATFCPFFSCSLDDDEDDDTPPPKKRYPKKVEDTKDQKSKDIVELKEEMKEEIQNLRKNVFEQNIFSGTKKEECMVKKVVIAIIRSLENSWQNQKSLNYKSISKDCKWLAEFDKNDRATWVLKLLNFAKAEYVDIPQKLIGDFEAEFPLEIFIGSLRKICNLEFCHFCTLTFIDNRTKIFLCWKKNQGVVFREFSLADAGFQKNGEKIERTEQDVTKTALFRILGPCFSENGRKRIKLKGLLKNLEQENTEKNRHALQNFFAKLK